MSSQFKTDENLPEEAAEFVRSRGFDCETVHDEGLPSTSDPKLIAACKAETRILLTLDLDFSDIRAYPPEDYCGIVVLRPGRQTPAAIEQVLSNVLDLLSTEVANERLWVCDETGCRIRGGD